MLKRVVKYLLRKVEYFYNRSRFEYLSPSSNLCTGLRIDCPENIRIEDGVTIQRFTWLAAAPLTGCKSCSLSIGKGTIIGNFNHIYATKAIEIGEYVLTADKVYISDCSHSYVDINKPVMVQSIKQLNSVSIGDGSWIGENVCIIGASIGKHCIIGANSVVTNNISDYSVAVGSPARIVKKYNLQTNQWEVV